MSRFALIDKRQHYRTHPSNGINIEAVIKNVRWDVYDKCNVRVECDAGVSCAGRRGERRVS